MLADGTITARIRMTVGLREAGQMLEKLRNGGLRGKAVIRLQRDDEVVTLAIILRDQSGQLARWQELERLARRRRRWNGLREEQRFARAGGLAAVISHPANGGDELR
jgi:hypothetical protein